jgi:hypothetical protein
MIAFYLSRALIAVGAKLRPLECFEAGLKDSSFSQQNAALGKHPETSKVESSPLVFQ